jgi:hypothetical protein
MMYLANKSHDVFPFIPTVTPGIKYLKYFILK